MKKSLNLLFSLCLLGNIALLSCSSSATSGEAQQSVETAVQSQIPAAVEEPPSVDIDLSTFQQKMQDEDVVILDVRTPGETQLGVIEGATIIDYRQADFKEKVQQLDKSKTYLVYCKSGGRSGKACEIMDASGFENVFNLTGGYDAWVKQ